MQDIFAILIQGVHTQHMEIPPYDYVPTKPSVAAVKRLNSWRFRAWSGIKTEIGQKYLDVPAGTDPTSWDMPQEWMDVIIKAKG